MYLCVWGIKSDSFYDFSRGRRGRDRMVVGLTTTYMLSMSISTDVVGSNLDLGEVYNIM
jgi:hypothetical protein